jgi:cytidine deaminase
VVTSSGATPCGACRQVLSEFAPNLRVVVADTHGQVSVFALAELLPHGFDARKLSDK